MNASAITTHSPVTIPRPAFAELLKCSSATRARMPFSNELEQKGCELDSNLAITKFILLSDWVNKFEKPDKLSLMWLGSNQKGVSYDSKNKCQLQIHFQKRFGKELSNDSIESLITCKFSSIEDYPDLEK